MANKIITLDSRFATGEPTVQLIATPGRDGRMLRERTSLHMSKTASQSPAMDYIRNVEPQPGKSIVLIIGLGDHETYGPNRNADGFPSEPVPGKITSDQVLTKHYKTYENANVFEHHVNHDPAKAIGKVLKAFWNHIMRRVEVLEDFDHEKAPHLLQRIGDGEFPSKSMGCGPAGTPVLTPTGPRPIEELIVGDTVITHRGRPRAITELHARPYAGDLCTVITAAGSSTMTADHPYAVPSPDGTHEHWVPAQELRPGMQVLTQAGYVPVLTVLRSAFVGEVYNFEVEEDHTYVVNGHAVHNCKIPYDVCFPAGTLVRTRTGTMPIEDVAVGDVVQTHTGAWHPVTETLQRAYSGKYARVRASGVPPINATEEHPFFVLRSEDVRTCTGSANGARLKHQIDLVTNRCKRCGCDTESVGHAARWVAANELRVGDYLLAPRTQHVSKHPSPGRALAQLYGYYLGDGHIITERHGAGRTGATYPTGFAITIGTHETAHLDAVRTCISACDLKNPARTYAQGPKAAVQVLVHDRAFADLLVERFGRGSHGKRLWADVFGWAREDQLALLGGYIDTDGCVDRGGVRITTVNRGLALDIQQLCHTLGIVASVTNGGTTQGGYSTSATQVWNVGIPRGCAQELRTYCLKGLRLGSAKYAATRSFFLRDYWVTPITAVTLRNGAGDVYNMSVECDESYVVEGVAVHNCTVCGNKAPTRKQYCDHLKYEMGKIYPDGIQACALNPSPKFFDSSWVIRPADRTGYMLKKVAYDEISLPSYELSDRIYELRGKSAALGKAADMEKVISGEPAGTSTRTDKGTLKLLKSYNDTVAPSEAAKLPPSDVRITIEYTPDQAVGTSDAMGLPMGLRDLVQYFMGRMGADGTPSDDDLDCACKHAEALMETFAAYPRFYEDVLKLACLTDTSHSYNDKLANALGAPQAQMPNERVKTPRWLPGPFASDTPNTDLLTFTDHTGVTHRTNMGQVRETNQALAGRAQGEKYVRGAGHLGLGAVLGTAGLGAIMTGGRSPLRRGLGALALAGGVASGAKGVHEALRPVRMGDLDGPKILTNEGQTISGLTQMKSGSAWAPEMVYSVLRQRDGVASSSSISLLEQMKCAEVHDDLSHVLGPTLDVAKVARIVETSILETP